MTAERRENRYIGIRAASAGKSVDPRCRPLNGSPMFLCYLTRTMVKSQSQ